MMPKASCAKFKCCLHKLRQSAQKSWIPTLGSLGCPNPWVLRRLVSFAGKCCEVLESDYLLIHILFEEGLVFMIIDTQWRDIRFGLYVLGGSSVNDMLL